MMHVYVWSGDRFSYAGTFDTMEECKKLCDFYDANDVPYRLHTVDEHDVLSKFPDFPPTLVLDPNVASPVTNDPSAEVVKTTQILPALDVADTVAGD